MQTRRDQLHAYRFLTKRALAALVAGEPNAVEPPMRRLTLTTVSGVMIAVLVGVGFAVFGLIKPSAGDSWKAAGVIVVERETGARYIYRDGRLDPVLNYSSGVLAVSGNNATTQAKVVLVDREEIASTQRGPTIGIDGIPDSLPGAGDIENSPWTVCSRQRSASTTTLRAVVSVSVGGGVIDPQPLRGDTAVLVNAPSAPNQNYLLWHGSRYALGSESILTALRIDASTPLTVGTSFLQSIDLGTALTTPKIPDLGAAGPTVDGQPTKVGQLLRATDTDLYSVVLSDGLQSVTALEAALLRSLKAPAELDVPSNALVAATRSPREGRTLLATVFRDLPADVPAIAVRPQQVGDICATFTDNPSVKPTFGVVSSQLPNFPITQVTETGVSAGGRADVVRVSPGHASLVRSSDTSPTIYAVAEPGKKYAFATPDLIAAFGYGNLKPAVMPDQLLTLLEPGPALNPEKALTPVPGSS